MCRQFSFPFWLQSITLCLRHLLRRRVCFPKASLCSPLEQLVSALCHCSLTLVYCAGFYEDDFPNVSI